jgi:hypothetical protein
MTAPYTAGDLLRVMQYNMSEAEKNRRQVASEQWDGDDSPPVSPPQPGLRIWERPLRLFQRLTPKSI